MIPESKRGTEQLNDELDTIILVPGREAIYEEIPKMTHRMLTNLHKYGFEFKVGYSKFFEPAQVYKGTDRKGDDKKPEKTIENVWIDAIHRERKIKLTATWHDGKFYSGWVGRSFPKKVNSTQLTKLIKGEVEK